MSTQQAMVLPIGMVALTDEELKETSDGVGPLALVLGYVVVAAGVAAVAAIIGGVIYAVTH